MNPRDYKQAWVSPEGAEYRKAVYERQREGGTKPLVDNPTVEELISAAQVHAPVRILEVGCGWGRILRQAREVWPILHGCDVSRDYLWIARQAGGHVFEWDITKPAPYGVIPYDVVFCRGLMMYFEGEQLAAAMQNMERITKRKVLVWEWTEVCERMRKAHKSDKFEYHAIPQREE